MSATSTSSSISTIRGLEAGKPSSTARRGAVTATMKSVTTTPKTNPTKIEAPPLAAQGGGGGQTRWEPAQLQSGHDGQMHVQDGV